MNTPTPPPPAGEEQEPQGKKQLFIYGLAGLLVGASAIFLLAPTNTDAPAEATTSQASDAYDSNTLEGRVYNYLQTDALVALGTQHEEEAQTLFVKYSRDLIKHNEVIDKKIENANRAAISNMIREVEDSYPELTEQATKELEALQLSHQEQLIAYQSLSEGLLANYPYQSEQEKAELAAIYEQWLEEHEEMLEAEIITTIINRLKSDIDEAMRARLKICHHYVGRYMGG